MEHFKPGPQRSDKRDRANQIQPFLEQSCLDVFRPSLPSEAERRIAGCERCHEEQSEIPFDWILADVLDKRGHYEFILSEPGHCPNCRAELSEKTLIEPQGGIEVEATA